MPGCTGGGTFTDGSPRRPGATRIRITPDDGAKGISRVRPDRGEGARRPAGVRRGRQVEDAQRCDAGRAGSPTTAFLGPATARGSRWPPSTPSTRWPWTATAAAPPGTPRSPRPSPTHRFIGYFTPENRSTVGTGMIVSLDFNRKIENRAAVERAIRVTARPAGRDPPAHWFGKPRLDFRPGSTGSPAPRSRVELRLRDVAGAPGVYGTPVRGPSPSRSAAARSPSSTPARHTMEVRRDGDAAVHRADHRRGPQDHDVQREDGGHRDARGDPDEQPHGRLRRRVRHPGRPARHAAHRLRHLPARQLLGAGRLRPHQRQPRLRRTAGRQGRRLRHPGRAGSSTARWSATSSRSSQPRQDRSLRTTAWAGWNMDWNEWKAGSAVR